MGEFPRKAGARGGSNSTGVSSMTDMSCSRRDAGPRAGIGTWVLVHPPLGSQPILERAREIRPSEVVLIVAGRRRRSPVEPEL
jgi:nucleotide-binding universal stress UspA family protein